MRKTRIFLVICITFINIMILEILQPTMSMAIDEQLIDIKIEDTNLYEFLKETLENIDGYDDSNNILKMTQDNIDKVEIIATDEKREIRDITGIEIFRNLGALHLRNNYITNIEPLANLTNLETLWLHCSNEVKDVDALKKLTKLTDLIIKGDGIVDISQLSGLTSIRSIWVYSDALVDITPLENLKDNLLDLGISVGKTADITLIKELKNLRNLHIIGKWASNDISFISNLSELKSLEISLANIKDISALSKLTNLQVLLLHYNEISDISILENLVNLNYINLSNNQVSDITPIKKLTKVENLYLNGNKININIKQGGKKTIELPTAITETKNKNSLIYTNKDYILTNCELTEDAKSVIVDTDKYTEASVEISGGNANKEKLKITVEADNELNTNQPTDNTIASGVIPQTGEDIIIFVLIAIIVIIGIVSVNKYRMNMDIK